MRKCVNLSHFLFFIPYFLFSLPVQLPGELLKSLHDVEGFNEASFKAVHETGEQVTSVRINPKKVKVENGVPILSFPALQLSPIHWCNNGFYLEERPSFTLDPFLHAGAYYVQEASSMFLSHMLHSLVNQAQHQVVLDLCAAPGGKSTLLASFFTNGVVISNEVIRTRVNILQENITKWGDENVVVTNNDSKDFNRLSGFFDVIVADVPCSGSGLFRKDPSAIEEWSPGNVNLCCQRQQRILADIIPCLKENGILIYSTCSYSPKEDEEILDWIVEEFSLLPMEVPVDGKWNIVTSSSARHQAKGYRFFPDKLKGEGLFIAAFKQVNNVNSSRHKEAQLVAASTKEREALTSSITIGDNISIFKHNDIFNLFPKAYLRELKIVTGQLYIRQAGVAAGSFKGKSFVPGHALALSNFQANFNSVELSKEEALSYLRKQDIKMNGAQGWCKVTYQGLGLGWIKNLPNRTNNYYPSEWRILKN